jgi:hypothetical protein
MTDPQHSLIAVLLDRSGSMESIKSDTEGGFNAFIAEQRKEPLDIRVTLAQFDTDYDVVYANRPVQDVPPLELQPRGMTALYDAVGKLITVVVLTDGHENSSQEWTHDAVSAAIRRQEHDYSWDFVFLGANIDAVAIGQQLGFAPEKSMTYAADGDGVGTAWAATTSYVARRNAAPVGSAVAGFSDEERAAAQGNR